MSKVKLAFSSKELATILNSMGYNCRYVPGGVSHAGSNPLWEASIRYWLTWNRWSKKQGNKGHDPAINDLKMKLRLLAAYKNAVAKEMVATGKFPD